MMKVKISKWWSLHFIWNALLSNTKQLLQMLGVKLGSIQFSCSVMSDSLRPHGQQHSRFPCPSPTPRACSNSCPLSQWCHPTTSSSVIPFSSCLQSFPASGSFPVSQFFTSGGQSTGVSASTSVLPMKDSDWSPSSVQLSLTIYFTTVILLYLHPLPHLWMRRLRL